MTKVLYVEDNDDNVYMLKMRLELLGDFEVLAAEDGEKGCEMAAAERPDIILMVLVGLRTNEPTKKLLFCSRCLEAYSLLQPVYGWFVEGFDTASLKDAKVLLGELRDRSGPQTQARRG